MYNTLSSLKDTEYPLDSENFEVIHQETCITHVFFYLIVLKKNLLLFNYMEIISGTQVLIFCIIHISTVQIC